MPDKLGWLILSYIIVGVYGIEAINSQISNSYSVTIQAFRGYNEQLSLLAKDRPITGVRHAVTDDVQKSNIPHNIERVVVFPAPFVPKKPKHSPS